MCARRSSVESTTARMNGFAQIEGTLGWAGSRTNVAPNFDRAFRWLKGEFVPAPS
jgi:hypothetical protein